MSIGKGIAVAAIWIACGVTVSLGGHPAVFVAAVFGTLFLVDDE